MVSGKPKIGLLLLLQLLLWSQGLAWETEILSRSDDGLTVQLSGISGDLQEVDGRVTCSGPGLMAVAVDSTLLLGQKALFLAVPANGEPTVSITAVNWARLGETVSEQSYSRLLESHAPGWMRQQRLLPLTLRPFRLHPDGKVDVAVQVTFRVDFNERHRSGEEEPLRAGVPESPVFEKQLQSMLVNYDQGRTLRRAPVPDAAPLTNELPENRIKIMVEEDGVYRVSWDWLEDNGVILDAVPSYQLRLYTSEGEVPIKVLDGQDGYFETGDYFLFYGKRQRGEFSDRSRYTPKSAYFFEYEGMAGARMVEVNSAPVEPDYIQPEYFVETVHQEQDLIYDKLRNFPVEVSRTIDHWYWELYEQGGKRDQVELDVAYPHHQEELELNTTVRAAFTSLSLSGLYDHHVICELNGQVFAGDLWWDGHSAAVTEFVVPDSIMNDQNNELVVYVPGDASQPGGDAEETYLNWVEVEYQRRFHTGNNQLHFRMPAADGIRQYQLTGFGQQSIVIFDSNGRWMSGFDLSQESGKYNVLFQDDYPWETQFHAVTYNQLRTPHSLVITPRGDLLTGSEPVDYIIIYHQEFRERAEQWADLWSSRYNVKLVDVESIYDTFGRGTMAPEPIQAYLNHAWQNYPAPAFSYVLLMGRGTYMYDKLASRHPSYLETRLPVYLAAVPHTTITASDEYFACFSGDDEIQDCFIGRLPMTDAPDFDNYFDKMLEYDFEYEPGLWHLTHTLISDAGTSFARPTQELIDNLMPPVNLGTMIDITSNSDCYGGNYELRQLIDAGTTTVSYLGHGSTTLMSAHGILSSTNYQLLLNQGRYPLGFSWSCLAGGYTSVNQRSVSELLVGANRKGYIASFGSAALALSTGDSLFMYQYYNSIFEDELHNHGTLGEITWSAELGVLFSGRQSYHTRMFNLLGDPALQFAHPRRSITLTPPTTQLVPGEASPVECQLDTVLAGEMSLFLYRDDGLPVNFNPDYDPEAPPEDPDSENLRPVDESHLTMVTETVSDGSGTLTLMLPDSLTMVNGFYRLVAYFDGGNIDGAGAVRVASGRPVLLSSSTIPATPQVGDLITFVAECDPAFPPDSVELFFEGSYTLNGVYFPMAGENGQFSVEIDEFVNSTYPIIQRYRYRLHQHRAEDTLTWNSPGFTVYTVEPAGLSWVENSLSIGGEDEVELTCQLRNVGQATIPEYHLLASESAFDTLDHFTGTDLIAGETATITLSFPQEQGEHSVQLSWQIGETPSDSMRQVSYHLIGPPGIAEMPLSHYAGWSLTVPPAALDSYLALQPQLIDSELAEEHTGQPGFSIPRAAGLQPDDLWLELLADSAVAVPELELTLDLPRPLESVQADTILPVIDSLLWISCWDSLYGYWVPGVDPVRLGQPDSLQIIQPLIELPLVARLNVVQDGTSPQVEYSVSNQYFAPGDYVARSPDFGFTIDDPNGIDFGNRNQAPVLFLDGDSVAADRYQINGHGVWAHLNLSLLDFEPNSLHTLELQAQDLMGNQAGDTLTFTAAGSFGLRRVATHPNPFSEEVIIAWELTDVPQSVSIKIFTTSGRLIRTMSKRVPRIGYDELIWDGRDDLGQPVANGVYYLKFIAESGSDTATKIVKLARLR